MFELGAVIGAGAVDLEKGVDVEGVGCHCWSITEGRRFLEESYALQSDASSPLSCRQVEADVRLSY